MTEIDEALYTDDAVEVFERSYADRHGDMRRERSRIPLRDCSNAACRARVQMGIPHCCEPCRAADKVAAVNGVPTTFAHSASCKQRQAERGVTL
jgi:hypothetical protein